MQFCLNEYIGISYLSSGTTVRQQWIVLEESYTISVQYKVMELRKKLLTLSKDVLIVSHYILKAKTIGRIFSTIGDLIGERNILFYMLRGLGPRYNNFVSNIKMR